MAVRKGLCSGHLRQQRTDPGQESKKAAGNVGSVDLANEGNGLVISGSVR